MVGVARGAVGHGPAFCEAGGGLVEFVGAGKDVEVVEVLDDNCFVHLLFIDGEEVALGLGGLLPVGREAVGGVGGGFGGYWSGNGGLRGGDFDVVDENFLAEHGELNEAA